MKTHIVLASQSPRRKELLTQIGLNFECIVSDADEVITETEPDEVVVRLSYKKASAVARSYQNFSDDTYTIFMGADTVVSKDNKILLKPTDKEDAFNTLKQLHNSSHKVFTGVCLIIYKGSELIDTINFAECTTVNMYAISDEEIIDYIATGEPMDKAGSYGIQGIGASFIRSIEGDYNNVVGLPIGRIYQEITRGGYYV